jgi:autotransporter-associated beta strand protein
MSMPTAHYSGGHPSISVSGGEFQLNFVNQYIYWGQPIALSNNAILKLNVSSGVTSGWFGAAISGTGSVEKLGAGTLQFGSPGSYNGATTISGGTLQLVSGNRIPDTSVVTVNGGTFDVSNLGDTVGGLSLISGTVSGTALLTVNSTIDLRSGTISTRLGGANGANKTTAGTVTLSGNNPYTGLTTISAGSLIHTNIAAAGAVTRDYDNSGTLEFNTPSSGFSELELSGTISGAGTLVKSGGGSMILSGNNTYTGATNVTAGHLRITHGNALGTNAGGTTVTSGATLALRGGINLAESVTISGTGVSSAGAIFNETGNNTITGNLSLGSATTLTSATGTSLSLIPASGDAISGSNTNLTLSGSGSFSVSGPMTLGSGTLTKSGTGTATLLAVLDHFREAKVSVSDADSFVSTVVTSQNAQNRQGIPRELPRTGWPTPRQTHPASAPSQCSTVSSQGTRVWPARRSFEKNGRQR